MSPNSSEDCAQAIGASAHESPAIEEPLIICRLENFMINPHIPFLE
jgi:hypothetical protein